MNRRLPWVAIALAVANVAVFAWEMSAGADAVKPDAQWMLHHGGNFGPVTLAGEQWRLFTSMFLHYGALHLIMNMIGLLDGGRHVERMYGHAGFAALYLVSGLAGSLATSMRATAVSAGASGAIFGVFGAFGAFLLMHRNRLDKEQVSKQARGLMIFLVYNIWFGISAKGIDLVAHFGGLVAGFGVGLALELGTNEDHSTPRRSIRDRSRLILVALLGTALMFGIAMVAPKPTNSLISFAAVETPVLARWNQLVPQIQSSSIADDKLAEIIEKELLPPWRAAHKAFEKEDRSSDRAEMLEYMTAREEGWELMAKGLRAQDPDVVMQGRKRFSEADAVIAQMNLRRTLNRK